MPKILICLLSGVSLSAATGIRAFLPLAMIGYAHTYKLFDFHLPGILGERLEQPFYVPMLIFVALVEIILYLIPGIDLAASGFGFFTATLSGIVVMFMSLYLVNPQMNEILVALLILLSIILGGGIAFGVNFVTTVIRTLLTGASIGLLNPILSLLETVVAFALSGLGIFLIGKI